MNIENYPQNYANLVHLFIELRGRGVSLSRSDQEILKMWKDCGIDPELIAKVMCDVANTCVEKSTPFPSGLTPIARNVRKQLTRGT